MEVGERQRARLGRVRKKAVAGQSDVRTAAFLARLKSFGLPAPQPEHPFAPGRKFRFDFAWPQQKVAVEMEGGVYGKGKACPACGRKPPGAHSSIGGIKRDVEKYNLAVLEGWRVLRFLPEQITRDSSLDMVRRVLMAEVGQ